MQSKTSFCEFFNKTLFRKNLTRFWPLWAAPSFIGALFPLAVLTNLLRDPHWDLTALQLTASYYEIVSYGLPIISLCYAILVAVAVWSYLFNARSVGLMHTLPIRREGLFLTGILSGMAMMLIPYVITGALAILVFGLSGVFNPMGILVTILCVIGESLFYFASATVVAFITGNLFAMPVLYFIFHFLAVALDFLINLFATGFLFGLQGDYSGVVEFLSPTVYLMGNVRCDRQYTEHFIADAIHGSLTPDGYGYYESELTSVALRDGWLIAVYALAGVVLLGIAYALYRRRRSESAGDVVSVGWMKPVFRYGVALCSAMAGGLALYAIFWGSFQSGDTYDVIPLAIAMLIAGVIGYYAANMLLAKSLRVFRGSLKGLVLTAACAVAICCSMYFDLFGVEKRVPTVDQIEYMTFYTADNNYYLYPDEDTELIEEVRAVHLAIAEDADYIRAMEENLRYESTKDRTEFSLHNTVRVNYYLKNGTSVSRRYSIPIVRSRLEDPDTYDYALDRMVNGQNSRNKRFHLNDGFIPMNGYIYLEAGDEGHHSFGDREARQIMAAVANDIANGTCGVYNWFESNHYDYSYAMDYALDLGIEFQKPVVLADGQNSTDYDSISIRVRPGMDHTVNALLQLGLADQDSLKTRLEMFPENYSAEAQEWLDKYGYVTYETDSFPTPTDVIVSSSPAASVGIIGGADGPTQVFVTAG